MALPKVWLVPYLKGWSYDQTAHAIARHLSHRFDFRIAYTADIEAHRIEREPADLVVDMWWHGTMHLRADPRRVVKQISSHRWSQMKWGRLKPSNVLERYGDVGAVVVPSRRLFDLFHAVESPRERRISIGPKGFEPSLLEDYRMRRGEQLVTGWVGASEAHDKHVDSLVDADPSIRLADKCLAYSEMSDFYNGIDVIAIASEAEGDPRPLIEGMACGCFPVTTNVGIVPELVRHGENGYIVGDRTPADFADAFAWCRANIELVRAAGRRNAVEMRATRTWAHVMPAWGVIFDDVLARAG